MHEKYPKAERDMLEGPGSFRVGDVVMIDYEKTALQRSYAVKRGELYSVAKVNTESKPFMYSLKVLNPSLKITYLLLIKVFCYRASKQANKLTGGITLMS